jgi:HEAT repeat protein
LEGDWGKRVLAAELLFELGTGQKQAYDWMFDALLFAFQSDRRRAAELLAKVGQPKWMGWVRGDTNDYARLLSSGDAEALDLFFSRGEAWLRGHIGVNDAMDEALVRLRDPRAESLVRRAIRRNPTICEAIARSGESRWAPDLVEVLLANLEEEVKVERRMGRMPTTDLRKVRMAAVDALARLGTRNAREGLIKLLGSASTHVELAAIEALAGLRETAAAGKFALALDHKDERVRLAAAAAFGKLGDARAVEPIVQHLLEDPNRVLAPAVRTALVESIAVLANRDTVEFLKTQYARCDRRIRKIIREALGRMQLPEAAFALKELRTGPWGIW